MFTGEYEEDDDLEMEEPVECIIPFHWITQPQYDIGLFLENVRESMKDYTIKSISVSHKFFNELQAYHINITHFISWKYCDDYVKRCYLYGIQLLPFETESYYTINYGGVK